MRSGVTGPEAAVAEDRDRIAADLNDAVIQPLFHIGLELQSVLGSAQDPLRSQVAATIDQLDDVIRQIRVTVFSLAIRAPATVSLQRRIMAVVSAAEPGLGFEPDVTFEGRLDRIEAASAEHLLQILGDLLGRVVIGATATRVRVSCTVGHDAVLTVSDDGTVAVNATAGSWVESGLSRRAAGFGGSLHVGPGSTGGTRSTYRVPVVAGT